MFTLILILIAQMNAREEVRCLCAQSVIVVNVFILLSDRLWSTLGDGWHMESCFSTLHVPCRSKLIVVVTTTMTFM